VIPLGETHLRELLREYVAHYKRLCGTLSFYSHRYAQGGFKGVRRVPLRATRHHVYYVVTHSTVHVIAVWGSVKKRGPKLVKPDE
jgi:hypothetical protein